MAAIMSRIQCVNWIENWSCSTWASVYVYWMMMSQRYKITRNYYRNWISNIITLYSVYVKQIPSIELWTLLKSMDNITFLSLEAPVCLDKWRFANGKPMLREVIYRESNVLKYLIRQRIYLIVYLNIGRSLCYQDAINTYIHITNKKRIVYILMSNNHNWYCVNVVMPNMNIHNMDKWLTYL